MMIAKVKNNHNMYTTNLEKEHYMQDRVNLKNDQTMMNCISCNNEKKITDIINLLIKTSMLKKKMSKDYS